MNNELIDFIVENQNTIECAFKYQDRAMLETLFKDYISNLPLTLEELELTKENEDNV